MKNKKIIKLINNERMNRKVSVRKACDATSTDICTEYDCGVCTVSSTDICLKDIGGTCVENAHDYCPTRDYAGCANGAYDYCNAVSDVYACIGPGQID